MKLKNSVASIGRPAAKSLLVFALLLFATEREARAYTDPGTGAMIWQMLAAGAVGVLFYFRRFISWFKTKKKDEKD
jgi:hypothetical protein